jgi:hypothetical protein
MKKRFLTLGGKLVVGEVNYHKGKVEGGMVANGETKAKG